MRTNIGNDVSSTPELERDLREAGIVPSSEASQKVTRDPIPVPFPFPPPTDEVRIAEELRALEAADRKEAGLKEIVEATPLIEEFLNNPEVTKTLNDSGYKWSVDGLSKLATPTRDPDLREFKKQVLSAFKHLGLDTKQFFGV